MSDHVVVCGPAATDPFIHRDFHRVQYIALWQFVHVYVYRGGLQYEFIDIKFEYCASVSIYLLNK